MTYIVSSGTLNPTIPIPFHTKRHDNMPMGTLLMGASNAGGVG